VVFDLPDEEGKALRWAIRMLTTPDYRECVLVMAAGDPPEEPAFKLKWEALGILCDAHKVAMILSSLLTTCGVKVVEYGCNIGVANFPYVSVLGDDDEPVYVSLGLDQAQHKVAALLGLVPQGKTASIEARTILMAHSPKARGAT
jgi:hypothetical protein